jgi:hypothetical protein
VRFTDVVSVTPPLVPATVMVYSPGVALSATVKVSCEELNPVRVAGLKLAVTPAGRFEALSAIAPVKPADTMLLIVVTPLVPAATVRVSALKNDTLLRSAKANPGTGLGAAGRYLQESLRNSGP